MSVVYVRSLCFLIFFLIFSCALFNSLSFVCFLRLVDSSQRKKLKNEEHLCLMCFNVELKYYNNVSVKNREQINITKSAQNQVKRKLNKKRNLFQSLCVE